MGKIVTSVLVFIFLAYHMFGAGMFDILERAEEADRRARVFQTHHHINNVMCPKDNQHCLREYDKEKNRTVGEHLDLASFLTNITNTARERFKNLTESNKTVHIEDVPTVLLSAKELSDIIRNVTDMTELATRHGIDPYSTEDNSSPEEWVFPKTNHFCMTVLTTIGYGRFSPSTEGGRLFCIAYGMFGIPLTVVIFAIVGEFMKDKVQLTADVIIKRAPSTWSPKNIKRATVTVYIVLGNLAFVIIPAVVFTKEEKWSYTEAFYFIFVTLSTVGFGDYMATRRKGVVYSTSYVIARLCWLYIGLAYFAVIFYLMTQAIQDARSKMEERVKVVAERAVTPWSGNSTRRAGKRKVRKVTVRNTEPTSTEMSPVD